MRTIISIVVLLGLMLSCARKQNGPVCTEEARAGLNIKVYAKETGKTLFDSVTVQVQDGNYTEILQGSQMEASFFGAFERAGNYLVNVSHPSYITQSLQQVVTKDECHVIPVSISFTLTHK